MTQYLGQRKDLYDDIRSCIRQGMTAQETANACDCSPNTVFNYTKDIRDYKPRSKRLSDSIKTAIIKDFRSGMNRMAIAEKYCIGYTRVAYLLKGMNDMVKDEAVTEVTETPETGIVEAVEDIHDDVNETEFEATEAPEEVLKEEVPHEPIFQNFTACFDGKFGRYTIRYNGMVRMMVDGNNSFEIPISKFREFANEFAEIAKRFGDIA